jgi:hypothetical protein
MNLPDLRLFRLKPPLAVARPNPTRVESFSFKIAMLEFTSGVLVTVSSTDPFIVYLFCANVMIVLKQKSKDNMDIFMQFLQLIIFIKS